jgi:two-component system response regulator CpxR
MERLLIIDDDVELCGLLTEYLGNEGFQVDFVHDGETGLQRIADNDYLLIVLDVMLPGMSGFDVLRRLRATSRIPVLLLTARGEDVDRIVGLEIGADDYMPKPFDLDELSAFCTDEMIMMPLSDFRFISCFLFANLYFIRQVAFAQ